MLQEGSDDDDDPDPLTVGPDDETDDFEDVSMLGRHRSYVWKHFLHSKSRQMAKCKWCGQLWQNSGCGSTSGMSRHLKSKHPTSI